MRNKIVMLFALLLVLVVVTGCSAEKKALEAGKEALANEELEKAKEQFKIAMDKGNEEATQYMAIIEEAEEFVADVSAKDYDTAVESMKTIRAHTLYTDINFITKEAEELLEEVVDKRKDIDADLKEIKTKFETEKKEDNVKASLVTEVEEILDEAYISEEQTNKAKELLKEIEAQIEKQQEKAEKEAEKKRKEKEKEAKKQEAKDKLEEENNKDTATFTEDKSSTDDSDDETGNDNGKLSKADAESLLFDYLKQQIPEEQLNHPQVHLNYDHDDENGNYIFQLFEVVIDDPASGAAHRATWGWYMVNPHTKDIKGAF